MPSDWPPMPEMQALQVDESQPILTQALARLKWWDKWWTREKAWRTLLTIKVQETQTLLEKLKADRVPEVAALEKQVRDLTAIMATRDDTIATYERWEIPKDLALFLGGGALGFAIRTH